MNNPEPTDLVEALRASVEAARARQKDRTILLPGGTRVERRTIPLLGTRIFLDHPDAPEDLRHAEIGAVVDGHLQLPETEFGISPAVLRAIADLLEGEPDG